MKQENEGVWRRSGMGMGWFEREREVCVNWRWRLRNEMECDLINVLIGMEMVVSSHSLVVLCVFE